MEILFPVVLLQAVGFYSRQKIRNLWVVSDLHLYLHLYNYSIRGLDLAERQKEAMMEDMVWAAED